MTPEQKLKLMRDHWYENPLAALTIIEREVRRELLADLRPVFESAAAHDQPLVEYHGRRLGIELLPLHGKGTR